MPAQNLVNYLEGVDKNGVKVKDWAVQIAPGKAECTSCGFNKQITFSRGLSDLTRHSETEHHRKSLKSQKKSNQPTLAQFALNQEHDKTKEKAKDLEIAVLMFLSRHSIPPNKAECLMKILKLHVTDSKIVENVQLSAEKARYVTIYGIGGHFEAETIEKVKNCDAFSCSIDESEVNKKSCLEFQVKFASEKGLESRHLGIADLEGMDAQTISETVEETFRKDNIDYKGKLINLGMDGCNTMIGEKTGVITRLKNAIPQLKSDGSCNLHHMSNAEQHATTEFDPDIKKALVDTYYDLGGAPGKGVKKQKDFIKICKNDLGFEPLPILEFVTTRWSSLPTCIKPILHNYDGLVKYYKTLKSPTDRQKNLIKFYVERCDLNRIRLKFLLANSSEYLKNIKFFEERSAHVHNTGMKLEDILVSQMSKVLDDKEFNELDDEDNLVRKSRDKLINIDLDKATKLSNKEMFITNDVKKELDALGLKPDHPEVKWLFDSIRKYHLVKLKFLLKYFRTALSSPVFNYLSGLDPAAQSHVTTPNKLKQLIREYPKVVDSIQFAGGIDAIKEEITKYCTDTEVKDLDKDVDYETFWKNVQEIKEGSNGWNRYDILPRFALCMATRYDANAEVERSFSIMNLIHQQSQRNRMKVETLNAHLHIKAAVESKENRNNCEKCSSSSSDLDHCHCCLLEITDDLRKHCLKAHKLCKEDQIEVRTAKDNFEEQSVAIRETAKQVEKERVLKLKDKIRERGYFCKSSDFEPIYKKKKPSTSKEKGKTKRASTSNNNVPSPAHKKSKKK